MIEVPTTTTTTTTTGSLEIIEPLIEVVTNSLAWLV